MSLTLEPLIIRRRCFSHRIRYSCLHSHSRRLHPWVTPGLHWRHDAPLPIHTPERHQPAPLGTRVNAIASADDLIPATLSARDHLTSELVRTLLRQRASNRTPL